MIMIDLREDIKELGIEVFLDCYSINGIAVGTTCITHIDLSKDPVLTIRHCTRVFVFVFTRRLTVLRSSAWKGILSYSVASVV